MGMRMAVLLLALPLVACGGDGRAAESEAAAVYESLLRDHCCIDHALVQEVTDTANLGPGTGKSFDQLTPEYSREVLQAIADLRRRSNTVRPLPDSLQVTFQDHRLTPDSAQALLEHVHQNRLRRLSDSATVVFISDVDFSRNGRVAVVRMTEVCGYLCGGITLRAVRKHPGGWVPAEVVWHALF